METPLEIRIQILRMEAALHRAGYTVADVLRDAGVAASSWQRWKDNGQVPLITTWARIQKSYRALVGPKPKR
jgi:hypothetical protein